MPKSIKRNLINEETVKLLKKFQILKDLTSEEIRLLLGKTASDYQERIARLLQYKKGETVIREGDFDSWIFWIVKGSFAVTKNDIMIAEFTVPGEVFGEMSSIDIDSRSASVVAKEESICVSIDMSVLDTIANETIKTKLKDGVQHLQTKRLNSTNAKLAVERQNLLKQQEFINIEQRRLDNKEKSLADWEIKLRQKEQKLSDS